MPTQPASSQTSDQEKTSDHEKASQKTFDQEKTSAASNTSVADNAVGAESCWNPTVVNKRQYVFDNVDELATYLCKIYPAITPIKLQKGLYFLYAYYVGTFSDVGLTIDDEEFPDVSFYPPELFKPEFQAWQLGPVLPDVYLKFRQGFFRDKVNQLDPKELFPVDDPLAMEVKLFIDAFFLKRVCRLHDFALVDRSHSDQAWLEAWGDGSQRKQPMDPQLIQDEYINMLIDEGTMYA